MRSRRGRRASRRGDAGLARRAPASRSSEQLDGPPPGWSNPDVDGGIVVPHADNEYCYGVNHSWGAQHDDYDQGKNDHFVTQNNPDGQRTFFYEDDTVIPFYYALASTFGVGDRYFCSVLSSTWPNRFFLMAATSFGIGDNSACTVDTTPSPAPQIFSLLEEGGHTWKDYTDGPHMVEFFPNFGFSPDALAHYGNVKCDLFTAIQSGTLPDVSFVMGDEVDEDSDEGPSDLPGIGGQVVETIIRTLFASPAWKDTAVFITYDENGGIADHVPPAPACEPDGYLPHDGANNALPGAFDSTGFRVPFIVVSPYARRHFASHVVHDHTSITRFIEARFGLPALTGRDANSTPPMEMFDFKNPPFMTPPTIPATTVVPPAILSQCGQSLAPTSCTRMGLCWARVRRFLSLYRRVRSRDGSLSPRAAARPAPASRPRGPRSHVAPYPFTVAQIRAGCPARARGMKYHRVEIAGGAAARSSGGRSPRRTTRASRSPRRRSTPEGKPEWGAADDGGGQVGRAPRARALPPGGDDDLERVDHGPRRHVRRHAVRGEAEEARPASRP